MSSEEHNTERGGGPMRHTDVEYEHADINTNTILFSLLCLAVAVVVAFIISVFVFRTTTKLASESDTPMIPAHRDVGPTMPPEPMLQGVPGHETDPQQDLRNKVASDEAANNKLGWITGQEGVAARIPVEEAMKIIVAKGLPGASAPAQKKQ
jgi:hypothetical protein